MSIRGRVVAYFGLFCALLVCSTKVYIDYFDLQGSAATPITATAHHIHLPSNEGGINNTRLFISSVNITEYHAKKQTWLSVFLKHQASLSQHNQISSRNNTLQTLPTIVIQLSGGLGNRLSKIAHGFSIALWLYYEYDIVPRIVMRHEDRGHKWQAVAEQMQQCFVHLRQWDFEEGNKDESIISALQQQTREASLYEDYDIQGINSQDVNRIEMAISDYAHLVKVHQRTIKSSISISNNTVPLPMLLSDRLSMYDLFVDRFIDEIRKLFEFDRQACCNNLPEQDETVLVSYVIHESAFVYVRALCIFTYSL
jgi:hypothetical protein